MVKKKATSTKVKQAGSMAAVGRPLPTDPGMLSRFHRAVHGFAAWLEAELGEAVAEATQRRLAAIRFVEQALGYVQQRWMVETDPSARRSSTQKPAGFNIDPNLVLALGCLEPTAFARRLYALHVAVEALEPFEGIRFPRKPVRVDKRSTNTAIEQDTREEAALAELRQCSDALLRLFFDLDGELVKRLHRAAKTGRGKRGDGMLTPPQLAERWGVGSDKVLAWIRSGELRASNIAKRAGGRPRYLIDPAEAEAFWARRSVEKPPPTKRRKRQDTGVTEYF